MIFDNPSKINERLYGPKVLRLWYIFAIKSMHSRFERNAVPALVDLEPLSNEELASLLEVIEGLQLYLR
jgi:hypothetical protein